MRISKYKNLLFFTIKIFIFISPTLCEPNFRDYNCDDEFGNYTTTSQFSKNLHKLFSVITLNTNISYGFYNLSVGQNLNVVNAVALCRGDIPTPDCKACIKNATAKLTTVCPTQKAAVVWYDMCTVRYSSQSIFKGSMSSPRYNSVTGVNATDAAQFNETVSKLMTGLAREAALGDSRRKFATGEATVSGSAVKVYGLLQCVPDLEPFDCLNCLRRVLNYTLADCCYGEVGVEAAGLTCSLKFDNHRFYKSAVVLPSLLSPPPLSMSVGTKTGNRSKRVRVAIAVSAPSVATLIVVLILMVCFLKRRQNPPLKTQYVEDESETVESLRLDFNIAKAATDNFSSSNKLGQGSFGTIYKGVIPSTGQLIAVKRLSNNSEQADKEFQTEALLLAKLQHRNLVKCLGYSLAKNERLLVYEFVPNRSLDLFLFGKLATFSLSNSSFSFSKKSMLNFYFSRLFTDSTKSVHLNWLTRYNIIGGIARGLLYLHEESRLLVVHRDLKASNVLLDAEMNPKISDFGMARLFSADQTHANTKIIAGTYGYMPPEYVAHGQFSIKTDVFSFGVLVLEIISGQKVSQAKNADGLLSFAWKNWSEGKALNIVDITMSGVNTTEALRCINIGLLCVQENAAKRPIMSSVVLMLNSQSVNFAVPSRPAFVGQNVVDSDIPMALGNRRPHDGSVNEIALSSLDRR